MSQQNGIEIERKGAIAIWRMRKDRGNSIDEVLVESLIAACTQAESDASIRGVLLASGHPSVFCPGLDLFRVSELDRGAMRNLMQRFFEALRMVYGLRKPVVAALNGHAIAGGCVIAMTADWRVLGDTTKIGLNEGRMGVPLPGPVTALLRATLPPQTLTQVVLMGRNHTGRDALAAGLADEVVPTADVEKVALERLEQLALREPPMAYATTKGGLRADPLAAMRVQEAGRLEQFLDAWYSPEARKGLAEAVAALRERR